MARTRWPPGPVNPGLLHRTGRSGRQRRQVPLNLGPGRQIVSQDSPYGVSRIGGQAGTQAPDPTPVSSQNRGSRARSTIHSLPAEYFRWPGWPTGWLKYAQIVHYGAAHHRPRDRQIMESGTLVTTHSVPVWVWCGIWVNASLAAAEPLHENDVTTDRTVLVLVTEQGRHSFRAACSAPRRRACRPALSAGRPARSAGSPGRARPAGLAGRSASARRPGRSRGGASDEPLGNLTAILRICRAGVRRLLPWRLRCRGIAPGRSGVPGLRRSCRPLAWAKRERRQSMR